MPSKNSHVALADILDHIVLVRQFVTGLSFEQFKEDRKTIYATIRCLEIISEATRRLPVDLQDRHAEIPWREIAGAGNIYRHDYDNVMESILWKTVTTGLTPLENVVQEELAKLP